MSDRLTDVASSPDEAVHTAFKLFDGYRFIASHADITKLRETLCQHLNAP